MWGIAAAEVNLTKNNEIKNNKVFKKEGHYFLFDPDLKFAIRGKVDETVNSLEHNLSSFYFRLLIAERDVKIRSSPCQRPVKKGTQLKWKELVEDMFQVNNFG